MADKHGQHERYVGFEIEEAMRYYLDEDRGAAVEDLADSLLDAAGLSSDTSRKNPPADVKVQIGHRINPALKTRFKQYVDEKDAARDARQSRLTYGEALATAMQEHAAGGRWESVRDKIDRVHDDAESLLAELNAATDKKLTTREKRTIAIADELGAQFTHDDLTAEIASIAGETVTDAYVPRVLDRLNYVEHPETRGNSEATIYLAEHEAAEIAEQRARDKKREAIKEAETTATTLEAATRNPDNEGQNDDENKQPGSASERNRPPKPDELSTAQRDGITDCGLDPDDPADVADFFGYTFDEKDGETTTQPLTDGGGGT